MKLVEFRKETSLHLGKTNPLQWQRLGSSCVACSPADMDVVDLKVENNPAMHLDCE